MKKKKVRSMKITQDDYIIAQRRASRMEEIEAHGKQISGRRMLHKSRKVYDRKRLKDQDSKSP